MSNDEELSSDHFTTLAEAQLRFQRQALHENTPQKVRNAIEGAFMAGAQSALVLLCEGLDISAGETPEVDRLHAEIQAYFATARARASARVNAPRIIGRDGRKLSE